ncbi:hypothetical protein B0H16DRAFT_1745936 [Mycena metata]|uniref:Uncharacterized protein n=1 Tax=Mycena metata TaxID=1033252 RepID=A0AAD7H0S3_9AGAR|nr:hypothetical protein B0H16DRAFT_1745936 [Mycena metata]
MQLHSDSVVPAEFLVQLVAPVFPRCRVLRIHATDSPGLDAVLPPIQSTEYAGLQDIALSLGGEARTSVMGSHLARIGPIRFDDSSRDLQNLSLHGISYEWGARPRFWALTALTIVDPATSLTWADFRYIATLVTTLQRLCLRSVSCAELPEAANEVLVFPSLLVLDLYFGSAAPSVSRLLRRCTTPNLVSLRFHADDFPHIMSMVYCEAILSTVRHLVISSTCGESFYWLLFPRMPLLRRLEILSHDKAMLYGLMEADLRLYLQLPSRGPACPLLEEIATRGATASIIRDFFMRRAARGNKLRRVIFTGGFIQRLMSEPDMAVLKTIPPAAIERCVKNGLSNRTDLVLDLADDAELPSVEMWNILRPILKRCRTLTARVRDAESWLRLDSEIQDGHMEGLESCVVQMGREVSDQLATHPVFLRLGEGFITKVTRVCLYGISLEWSYRHNFTSLSSLTIIDPAFPPSWTDYRTLATNAAGLRQLCLRNAGCSDSPFGFADVVNFPCLDELDYSFGERAPASSLFIRHCSMPVLRVLRFNADEPGHLMALAFCASMLSTVEVLCLSGMIEDDGFAYFLFLRLQNLTTLSLPTSDASFLDAILVADSRMSRQLPPEGPACPLLSKVRIESDSSSLVRQFVSRRGRYAKKRVETVEFTTETLAHIEPDELKLLSSEVEVSAVGADPVEPPWIAATGCDDYE